MLGVALRVGSGVITLPLALHILTPSELGLYYTFLSLTGLAMLLDFGFAHTINRNAAFAMGGAKEFQAVGLPKSSGTGEPNWNLLAALLAAVKTWYRSAGAVLLLLMLIPGSLFLLPILKESRLSHEYLVCWWFYSGITVFSFVANFWPGLLFGIGSVRSAARIGMISQLIGLIIIIAGLLAGLGLWTYALSGFASTTMSLFLTRKEFIKDAGQALLITVDKANRNCVLKSLWPMAWRQGLVMIGAFLVQRGNTLICGHFLGLQDTASFGLSLNLLNIILQVSSIPLTMAIPQISSLRVNGDIPLIRKLFFSRTYLGLLFAFLSMSLLALVGSQMLVLLGSKTDLLSPPLFTLLCIILLLENHHVAYCNLVNTQNENPFVALAIIAGVVIFTSCWFGAKHYGIKGILVTQGLLQLMWANWWPVVLGIKSLKKST